MLSTASYQCSYLWTQQETFDEALTRDVLSVSLMIGSFFLKSQTTQRGANVEARICCTEMQKINPLHSANKLTFNYHVKQMFPVRET
jgi:hypothetical protein